MDPTHAACVAALQDLDRLTALHGRFDGLLCVDAIEPDGGLVTDERTGDGYLHLHCRAVTHR